jgi:hypothetical protein
MSARLNENKLWSVHDLADFLGVPVPTVRVPTTRHGSGRRYKVRFVGPEGVCGRCVPVGPTSRSTVWILTACGCVV